MLVSRLLKRALLGVSLFVSCRPVDRENPVVKAFLELSGLEHERMEPLLKSSLVIWIDEHFNELPDECRLEEYRKELRAIGKACIDFKTFFIKSFFETARLYHRGGEGPRIYRP